MIVDKGKYFPEFLIFERNIIKIFSIFYKIFIKIIDLSSIKIESGFIKMVCEIWFHF